MYSPVSLGALAGAGLGPVAVLPEHQRRGIGSRLIEAGNRKVAETGCPFIVVLGHADYYPRFGFRPARSRGITCQWDVPDDVFMMLALDAERMQGNTGLAKYRPEFADGT
jgi:putative acetyltransferase